MVVEQPEDDGIATSLDAALSGDAAISVVYEGVRFDNHTLPVIMMPDLQAYRDLVVAFSKDAWSESHDGSDMPRKMADAIQIDLISMGEGSTALSLAVADWPQDDLLARTSEVIAAFKEGVIRSAKLYADAARGVFPKFLSRAAKSAVDTLGVKLPPNHGIKLGPKDSNAPSVTPVARKAILKAVKEEGYALRKGEGSIIGIRNVGKVEIFSEEFGEFWLPVDPEDIIERYGNTSSGSVVFEVEASLDDKGFISNVRKTSYAHKTSSIFMNDVSERIDRIDSIVAECSALSHDNGSRPIDDHAVSVAKAIVNRRQAYAKDMGIFATDDGGLQIEMESKDWSIITEVYSNGRINLVIYSLRENDEVIEENYNHADNKFFMLIDEKMKGYKNGSN